MSIIQFEYLSGFGEKWNTTFAARKLTIMPYLDNTMIIRRRLVRKVVQRFFEGCLVETIDRIPLEMSPREKGPERRCCIYKERAVTRYKLMPILGLGVDEETDELTPLSVYAQKALDREKPSGKILTVVDEACTSCVKANYVVTNLCRGCVASPCIMNCPVNAIRFNKTGAAEIKSETCINCGKCKEACPYHSIVYMPIPCEEVCPVGAISKDERGIEQIDEEKCIFCGRCLNACPFGSVFEVSHLMDVLKAIQQKKKVVAMVAPALLAQYDCHPGQVFEAIKKIGFSEVIEVAKGAEITVAKETEELKERLHKGAPFMTTSCCPAYVELSRKKLTEIAPFVSETRSPMHYTAELARRESPDAVLVFIGPCVAKRKEGIDDEFVDFVLSFEELDTIFEGLNISVKDFEATGLQNFSRYARGFARSGGVIAAVKNEDLQMDIQTLAINGLNKKSIGLLKAFAKGKGSAQFVEVMACEGGCIAGPVRRVNPVKGAVNFEKAMEILST